MSSLSDRDTSSVRSSSTPPTTAPSNTSNPIVVNTTTSQPRTVSCGFGSVPDASSLTCSPGGPLHPHPGYVIGEPALAPSKVLGPVDQGVDEFRPAQRRVPTCQREPAVFTEASETSPGISLEESVGE